MHYHTEAADARSSLHFLGKRNSAVSLFCVFCLLFWLTALPLTQSETIFQPNDHQQRLP